MKKITTDLLRLRKIFINLVTIGCAVVVALLIAEVVLRKIEPSYYTTDPLLGVIGNPGGENDANGYRNEVILAQSSVVALGDSQTYGDNATREDAWPQQLGRMASTSVYQYAWGGYGPMEYRFLFDKALTLKPRTILVGFYLGNDVENAVHSAYQHEEWSQYRQQGFIPDNSLEAADDVRFSLQTGLPPNSLALRFYKFRLAIRQSSRVYTLLGNSTRDLREWLGLARSKDEKTKAIEEFSNQHPEISTHYDEGNISTILSPAYRADVVDIKNRNTKEGWRITQEVFREMNQIASSSRIRMTIVVIPTKEYVYGMYMREKGVVPKEMNQYLEKEELLQNEVHTYCSDQHIDCVFTADSLVQMLRSGVAIYPTSGNSHPIARGYQSIAETVYERIKTEPNLQ